jgi:WXG100 family type VII secretion target
MTNPDTSNIVVRGELEGAGAYLNSQAQGIADELNSLISQLEPIAETWQGHAKDYYEPLQQEWNVAAAGLLGPDGVLGLIASAMNVTWGNYSDAEWSNVSSWPQNP